MYSDYVNLTKDNYLLQASKHYAGINYVQSEFTEDIKAIKYIKKLLQKYRSCGILKERLILNHIICLSNVFGVEFTTRLLFFRIQKSDHDILKAFLTILNYMPDIVYGIDNENIKSDNIKINEKVATILKGI